MLYRIEFDVAAIIFLTLMFFSVLMQKRFSTRSTRAILLLIGNVILACIVNILISHAMFHYPDNIHINGTLSILVAVFANLTPVFYFIFIYATTHKYKRIAKKFWYTIVAAVGLEILLILSTPVTHFLYKNTPENMMAHSYGYFLLYLTAFLFILLSVLDVYMNRKLLTHSQVLFLTVFSSSTIVLVAFQLKYTHMSTTGFACATAVFAAFLTMQNPGTYYDVSTGTLNKTAFIETLVSIPSFEGFPLIIFKMTKTNKIKDLFGIEGRYYITRQFMETIRVRCHVNKIYYLFNDTYIIILNKKQDPEQVGESIRELTTQSLNFSPVEGSNSIINYRITGRINVINDINMIIRDREKNTFYTADETISIINFIATSIQPHHYTIISYETIRAYQEQIRLKHIVANAIKNESFEVFMQPIFSIKENTFVGAEALLRLKDSDGTYIPPLSFIPEAEANGDIIPISDIMLQKTCEFINETRLFDKGIQTVNINLSMIQCMYEGIIDHICAILKRNHVSQTLIRFEITESVAVTDEVRFSKLLEEMTARGIEYALDDYGTGYSNTSKILNHSFSEIKFDKSLIDSMSTGTDNEKAIHYLFDLTKEKKMISLAEGVETKEAVEMLKKIGCDLIQGFYYAKPMPAKEFAQFLDEHC